MRFLQEKHHIWIEDVSKLNPGLALADYSLLIEMERRGEREPKKTHKTDPE